MQRRDSALNHSLLKLALVGLVSLLLTACGGETPKDDPLYPTWDGTTPVCGEDGILQGSALMRVIEIDPDQYQAAAGIEYELNHFLEVLYEDGTSVSAAIEDTHFLAPCKVITGNIGLQGTTTQLQIFDTIEEVHNISHTASGQYWRPEDGKIIEADHFPNLQRIEGSIYFEPKEIHGLNALEYLGGGLFPKPDIITGLNALLVWNQNLVPLPGWTGLQALERVNGDANEGLREGCDMTAPFPNLKVVTGSVGVVQSNCSITFPALEEVGGELASPNADAVILPSLKRIGQTLFVRGYGWDGTLDENGQIPSIPFELPMLEEVGGHLWINGTLAETLVLPSLRRVEHWFFVVENSRLEDSSVEQFRDQLDHYGTFVNCRNKGSECLRYDFPPSLDFD